MPRIDPLQLLRCLSVLLSKEGGIISRNEVPRLVNLMTKFSKKLVSKCVYLLILKTTDETLVDMFMSSGGWLLVHTWLQEAMGGNNWNLVKEVLELLLVTPVDSARLRLNNIPKLVKTLSKREDLPDVKDMAGTLVNNWLAIVKNANLQVQDVNEKIEDTLSVNNIKIEVKNEPVIKEENDDLNVTNEIETVELHEAPTEDDDTKVEVEEEDMTNTGLIYKITVRDGKQIFTKLSSADENDDKQSEEIQSTEKKDDDKDLKKDESKSKSSSSRSKSSSSSSSSSKKSSSSSSRSSSNSSRDKDRKHSSSSKHSSSKSSSSSSRDKDKDRSRDKDKRKDRDKENDKDKHRSNGHSKSSSNSKSSSSSSTRKESKEKQSEKDKDTLAKLKPASIDKIGRIPKKPTLPDDKEIKKKPTISIEPKKNAEDRPKTVKIFNSKMRSTGLEEEVKPPPPRNSVKKNTPIIPPVISTLKRPSPSKELTPPEKKLKLEIPERAGAIKLIPPKPKPPLLLESDIFSDALTAAINKKEPKRKKRRLSVSKDSPENSPAVQSSPAAVPSTLALKNITPANFYQDTLETKETENEETNEKKSEELPEENIDEVKVDKEVKDNSEDNSEVSEQSTKTNSDGLKGVLVHFKKKGPKRSIKWKEENDLVEVRYFELDETERVNVSRTNFTDLAKLEMTHEREALLGRKLINEDLMEPTIMWRLPCLVDQPDLPVQPGCRSLEKDIQYAREKNILQALYFSKNLIPDSPTEPLLEIHPMVDPVVIPLEDSESQVYDLKSTPWPEPKGMQPIEPPPVNMNTMPPLFPNIPGPFTNFPPLGPQNFPNGPSFCPPSIIPNVPPTMIPNSMSLMGNPNPAMMNPNMDLMNQGGINSLFGPNVPNMDSNFNPAMMMNDNSNFPMPFNQPNNFVGPPNNFNNSNNVHRGRGNFRRGHNNPNWNRNGPRGAGNNNWRNNSDHRSNRPCKNIKNHGYCRNIDSCPFLHPN